MDTIKEKESYIISQGQYLKENGNIKMNLLFTDKDKSQCLMDKSSKVNLSKVNLLMKTVMELNMRVILVYMLGSSYVVIDMEKENSIQKKGLSLRENGYLVVFREVSCNDILISFELNKATLITLSKITFLILLNYLSY